MLKRLVAKAASHQDATWVTHVVRRSVANPREVWEDLSAATGSR